MGANELLIYGSYIYIITISLSGFIKQKKGKQEKGIFIGFCLFFIFIGFYHYVAFYGFYHYVAFYWVLSFFIFIGFYAEGGVRGVYGE